LAVSCHSGVPTRFPFKSCGCAIPRPLRTMIEVCRKARDRNAGMPTYGQSPRAVRRHEARKRQLADVESLVPHRAEEHLLRRERHDDRVDALDVDGAVDQRAIAVVIANCNR
jgi:hypothetical protein